MSATLSVSAKLTAAVDTKPTKSPTRLPTIVLKEVLTQVLDGAANHSVYATQEGRTNTLPLFYFATLDGNGRARVAFKVKDSGQAPPQSCRRTARVRW